MSQPALPVKGRLERLFLEYEEIHQNLKSAQESSMNWDEDFRSHQATYLLHTNLMEQLRKSLDRIIHIQTERRAKINRTPCTSSAQVLESTLTEARALTPIKLEKPIKFSGDLKTSRHFEENLKVLWF